MTKTNVDMGAGVEVERDWGGGFLSLFFCVSDTLEETGRQLYTA